MQNRGGVNRRTGKTTLRNKKKTHWGAKGSAGRSATAGKSKTSGASSSKS
jgi:hypothetical protein